MRNWFAQNKTDFPLPTEHRMCVGAEPRANDSTNRKVEEQQVIRRAHEIFNQPLDYPKPAFDVTLSELVKIHEPS